MRTPLAVYLPPAVFCWRAAARLADATRTGSLPLAVVVLCRVTRRRAQNIEIYVVHFLCLLRRHARHRRHMRAALRWSTALTSATAHRCISVACYAQDLLTNVLTHHEHIGQATVRHRDGKYAFMLCRHTRPSCLATLLPREWLQPFSISTCFLRQFACTPTCSPVKTRSVLQVAGDDVMSGR